jgi:hypothetical protein
MTLMNGPEKKTDSSRNRWNYYDSPSEQTTDADKFWVEADLERNRLLLRANDVELAEVKALLVKLGELPADQRGAMTMRVVPFSPDEESVDSLKRVKTTLESTSGNPVEIEVDQSELKSRARKPATIEEMPPSRRRGPSAGRAPSASHETRSPKPQSRYRLAQDRRVLEAADEPPSDADVEDSEGTTEDAADPADGEAPAKAAASDDDQDSDRDAESAEATTADAEDMAAEASDDAEPAESEIETRNADGPDEPVDADQPDDTDEPNDAQRRFEERERSEANAADLPRSARAPVKITVGPQGLVISSSDTDALDRLEELLTTMMPKRPNFKLFTLKHTYAKDMVSLLKDVFKADLDKESSRTEVFDMFWNGRGSSSSSQTSRASLGRRRPLNFVADPVTNTVLVQGADTAQLAEVEGLIERYDRAEPPNSESVRRTKHVPLKYARAKEVADVLKDVYRDLLSPNDKALLTNQPPQQQQQRGQNDNFYSAMFSYLTDDPTKSEIVPRFKGMLSVGVDERANGVVVSAPQIILTEVLKMVEDLDRSARPSRPVVRVIRVKSPGVANEVRQAVMGKKAESDIVVKPSADQEIRANSRAGNVQIDRSGGGTALRVSR